jgi:glucosamine-6-phosphate deaminase
MKLIVEDDFEKCSRRVADMFVRTVKEKPDALLGCATGGSTIGVYKCLAEDYKAGLVDFSDVRTVNLDEYIGIGHSHPQSFAYFMRKNFFSQVNIKKENIFLVDGSKDFNHEVQKFNEFLSRSEIDILVIGIGTNGHIGFNEPGEKFISRAHAVELAEETILANSRFFENAGEVPRKAMTMGIGDVAKAKKIVLIANGQSKADAVGRLFADDFIDPQLPCSILKVCRDVTVIVDRTLADSANLAGSAS